MDRVNLENLEELKPGEGVTIDDKTTYEYGGSFEANSGPLIDTGEGNIVTIRTFEFKMNPAMIKSFPTDKQTIFNAHAKQIAMVLWSDGLQPLDQIAPRVIINKKKATYQIFVTCEAKRGLIWSHKDKPKNLTQELSKNAKTNVSPRT